VAVLGELGLLGMFDSIKRVAVLAELGLSGRFHPSKEIDISIATRSAGEVNFPN
jgi:hypothetical protein